MQIRESGEDYLETILLLSQTKDGVHSVDVANALGYSKPSITRAMGILKNAGYIVFNGSHIVLTEKGLKTANEIYARHQTITQFLMCLGVGKENASADACRMEHDISDESYEMMKQYVAKSGK